MFRKGIQSSGCYWKESLSLAWQRKLSV